MMLGILLSILAMIFTVYIPSWAKSGEANHMESVVDSYFDFKSNIDKQIGDEKGVGSSLTTQIKLGAEGGSVLGIGQTTGTLSYRSSEFNIRVYNTNNTLNNYGQASGNVYFTSRNVYYTNQYLTYENGAIIVEQSTKSIMRAKPDFGITYSDNRTTLILTQIHLSGTSNSISGTGHHTIESKLIQSITESPELIWTPEEGFPAGQNITVNITTRFGNLWKEIIEEELDNLPNDVRNNSVDLNLVQRWDTVTKETIYDVVLEIDNVYKMVNKIGIVELKLS
jgi:hypothetical protein